MLSDRRGFHNTALLGGALTTAAGYWVPGNAKGRAGDCPGPRKETTTRRNVTQGVGIVVWPLCCTTARPLAFVGGGGGRMVCEALGTPRRRREGGRSFRDASARRAGAIGGLGPPFQGNAVPAVCPQCKVLYVGKYSNPSFGPFPQVCCSITGFSQLLVHLGCAIIYLSPIFTHFPPFETR